MASSSSSSSSSSQRKCGDGKCWDCNGPFEKAIKLSDARAAQQVMCLNATFYSLLSQACCSVWKTADDALYSVAGQFLDVLETQGVKNSGQISSIIIAIACAVDALPTRECLKPGCSSCKDECSPVIRGEHLDSCKVLLVKNSAFETLLKGATCETVIDLNPEKLNISAAFLEELAIEAVAHGVQPVRGNFGAILVSLACFFFGTRY